jgi:hypothetical protein
MQEISETTALIDFSVELDEPTESRKTPGRSYRWG